MRLSVVQLLTILASLSATAHASLGDDLEEFQSCRTKCEAVTCSNGVVEDIPPRVMAKWVREQHRYHYFDETPLSWHLRLLGWKCEPNCDYQCQRIITIDRQKKGQEVYQFHGKWPFIRVFGVQELFSTIFSIGNWFPHYWGFKAIWKQYRYETKLGNIAFVNLYFAYLIIASITMCAWFFSTLFHLRDNWDRERLDYFFAGATVLSGFYGITIRVFKLYQPINDNKRHILTGITLIMYICHITRLLVDWSYTYNMEANVFMGVIQNFLWIYQAVSSFMKLRPSSSLSINSILQDIRNPDINWTLTPIVLVVSVSLGMSFELFDFAPWFDLIDAHSLWHLATIWPALYWYNYMIRDINEGLKDRKYE